MKMYNDQSKRLTKAERRLQTSRHFIQVAGDILDEFGLEGITIRKVAQVSGLHNSTIYVHFKDLDELIMLASMKYFCDYSAALAVQSEKKVSPVENFFSVWELFIDTLLKKPKILYNFFFGYKNFNLHEISNKYYDIFPELKREFSPAIHSMYFGENVLDRNTHIQRSLLGQGTPANEENMDFLSELSVSYCKFKLEEKIANPEKESEKLKDEFMHAIHYLFDPIQ